MQQFRGLWQALSPRDGPAWDGRSSGLGFHAQAAASRADPGRLRDRAPGLDHSDELSISARISLMGSSFPPKEIP